MNLYGTDEREGYFANRLVGGYGARVVKPPPDALVPIVERDTRVARPLPQQSKNPVYMYLARLNSARSRRTQAGAIKTIIDLLGGGDVETFPWADLSYEHGRALQAQLRERFSPATANRILSAFRGVMEEGFNLGIVTSDTLMRIKHIRDVKYTRMPAGRMIENDELTAMLKACDDKTDGGLRDAALITLMAYGGMRRHEAVSARLEQYDRRTGRLQVVGKGNKERVIILGKTARGFIDAWLTVRPKGGEAIVTRLNDAGELTPEATFPILRKRATQAGVDGASFSSHDFRRSAFSHGFNNADARTVQRFAGHASLSTTANYDRRSEDVLVALGDGLDKAWSGRDAKIERLKALASSFADAADEPVRALVREMKEPSFTWTREHVRTIFASSGSSMRTLAFDEVDAFIAASGKITVECVPLPTLNGEIPREFFRGGGEDHARLKAETAQWLLNLGHGPLVLECPHLGFRVDVAAPKQRVFVECGDTECMKVLALLENGDRVMVAPFYGDHTGFLMSADGLALPKPPSVFHRNAAKGIL